METENKVCPVCSGELTDNGLCQKCNINFSYSGEQADAPKQKSKKKIFVSIVISVLVFIIGVAGNFLAGRKNVEAELRAYIEKVSQYTPGKTENGVYTSSVFEIEFNKNKHWEMFSEDELEIVSQGTKSGAAGSLLEEMEKQNVSKTLRDMYEQSIYIETEMAAVYMKDDAYIGQVELTVLGAYGVGDIESGEYAEFQKEALTDAGIKDVKHGKEKLSGKDFDVVYAQSDQDGDLVKVKFYIIKKDGMFCMISLQYLGEYESVVLGEFESAIK